VTEYVVLAEFEANGRSAWRELGRRKAHNPRAAIQACLLDKQNTDVRASSYVGIPARNFKPEHPQVEEVQKVVFGRTLAEADSE
jgi:hypothetical protein